jgi:hypothetical protein
MFCLTGVSGTIGAAIKHWQATLSRYTCLRCDLWLLLHSLHPSEVDTHTFWTK